MTQVQRITCINNAGFVMNFSIRWQDINENWNITQWNSGNYPINETRTSPDLETIGVNPIYVVAVTPYVQAIAGNHKSGSPSVEYQPNDRTATYQVKGTTLDYSVGLIE